MIMGLALNTLFFSLLLFNSLFASESGKPFSYYTIGTTHVLEINPKEYAIVPKKALDDGLGRETTSSISKRYDAVAAINGGFFRDGTNFDGLALGILKINNSWMAFPHKPRGAIGWSQDGMTVLFDQLLTLCAVDFSKTTIIPDGINRPRQSGEVILYTSAFHRTTLTSPDSIEIIISNDRILKIVPNGNNMIPQDGYVLSFGADRNIPIVAENDSAKISFMVLPQSDYTTSSDWDNVNHIVGGTPILVRNGEIIEDFSAEKTLGNFISDPFARTAIGIKENGNWIFVVVDRTENYPGMTIPELATLMKELGAVEALNLCGGRSSTMVINGELYNHPYNVDEGERRVSDAILVLER